MFPITQNSVSGDRSLPRTILSIFALAGLLSGTLMVPISAGAATSPAETEQAPNWRPTATERLVKLPSAYLNKAVERDFKDSGLSAAIGNTNGKIRAKERTLRDFQAAMDKAEGEVLTELKHQFLAEKQAYIRLLGARQDMSRQHLETKAKIYGKILRKLGNKGSGQSSQKAKLIERQKTARQRFEGALAQVDVKIFSSGVAGESKYSAEFAKNVNAIERLIQALAKHPMNAEPELNGNPISKADYLRGLVANAEADLAILDQEESILGYMAKLVALDAMALAENLEDVTSADGGNTIVSVSSAVDFFASQ